MSTLSLIFTPSDSRQTWRRVGGGGGGTRTCDGAMMVPSQAAVPRGLILFVCREDPWASVENNERGECGQRRCVVVARAKKKKRASAGIYDPTLCQRETETEGDNGVGICVNQYRTPTHHDPPRAPLERVSPRGRLTSVVGGTKRPSHVMPKKFESFFKFKT